MPRRLMCCLFLGFAALIPGLATAKPLITSSETSHAHECLRQEQSPARLLALCARALEEARITRRDRLDLMVALAEAQGWVGKDDAAEATLIAARSLAPKDEAVLTALAWHLWDRDKNEEARVVFQDLIDLFGSAEGYGGLANLSRFLDKDYDEARRLIDIALAIDPEDAWYHRESGWLSFDQEHFKAAVRAFETSTKLDPDSDNAFFGMMRSFYEMRRYEQALNALGSAIALAPEYGRYYAWRASTLRRLDRNGAAVSAAQEAIRLTPTDSFGHVMKAAAELALEQTQDALDTFEGAVAAKASDNYLHYWYADTLFDEAMFDLALTQIDLALGYDDVEASNYELKARIALELDELPAALSAAQEAQALAPDTSYPVYLAALALLREGKDEAALAEYDRAVALGPDDEMTSTFARWLVRMGKPMTALGLRQRGQ